MYSDKDSSFGARPRASTRTAYGINENIVSRNAINTRSQALKDIKASKIPTGIRSSNNPAPYRLPNHTNSRPDVGLRSNTNVQPSNQHQPKIVKVISKKTETPSETIPTSNIITRSKSASVSGAMPHPIRAVRPTSSSSSQLDQSNNSRQTQEAQPRLIARPRSIVARARVNAPPAPPNGQTLRSDIPKSNSYSTFQRNPSIPIKSSSSNSVNASKRTGGEEGNGRVHPVRRTNTSTSLSTKTFTSNNSNLSSNNLSSVNQRASSSASTASSSGSVFNFQRMRENLESRNKMQNQFEDDRMDIDSQSCETLAFNPDPSAELVIEESDTECIEQTTLPKVQFEDNKLIAYALHHKGKRDEVPITKEEILEFEDDVDPYDTTLVPSHSDDIFAYMRSLEATLMPKPDYMDYQPSLHWSMRSVLVDWLIQVHEKFGMQPETIFFSMNIVDRFLSEKTIPVEKVQLVGVVALLIAAKYDEVEYPCIKDLIFMTENAYTVDEVKRAERYVLRILDYDLGWPGPINYLRRISKADDYDIATRTLSKYILEAALMDEYFIGVPSSKLAAVAHYLSVRFMGKMAWTRSHAYYSGYFESELLGDAAHLIKVLQSPEKHLSIYKKYSEKKYMCASIYVSQWLERNNPRILVSPLKMDISPDL
ncbi:hypothetical protein BB560_003361 [Smittium megazygosporum]|uniref:Uncharacterized protein n=1 Tax=Smittium megazygosporum TaxID=133381 RepID=A0A2T9ZC91_9FUNG|nr:hypothetical protein BB560_003361 [Smittium megazygosporum]